MDLLPLESEENLKSPWGFWTTIGISLAVYIVSVLIATTFYQIILHTKSLSDFFVMYNGLLVCLNWMIEAVSIIILIILFTHLRLQSSFKPYLGLNLPSKKQMLIFLLAAIGVSLVCHLITLALGMSPRGDMMIISLYKTSYYPALMFATQVIVGPISYEFLFRGFMFPGIKNSKLGVTGAIIITSLLWALLGFQYGITQVIGMFLIGLLLGFTRHRTNSIYLTIVMNSFINVIGFTEMLFRTGILHL